MKNLRKIMGEVTELCENVTCKPLSESFSVTSMILSMNHEPVMKDACYLRRKGLADSRAEALEGAFDFALAKAMKNTWIRTGEIFVDRETKRIRAFCVSQEELKAAQKEGRADARNSH